MEICIWATLFFGFRAYKSGQGDETRQADWWAAKKAFWLTVVIWVLLAIVTGYLGTAF